MAVNLKEELDGTLPIILLFLARTNNHIVDISPVEINDKGEIIKSSFADIKNTNHKKNLGAEIIFESSDTAPQKYLYYFSVDLFDGSLKKTTGFLNYVKNLGAVETYIKSASYLMHKNYFSTIRSTILGQSKLILQDDSGIPFRFFDKTNWDITLYGKYNKPIELFEDWEQKDLKKAYKDSSTKPLNFGIGYNWQQGQSNMLIAKKKRKG